MALLPDVNWLDANVCWMVINSDHPKGCVHLGVVTCYTLRAVCIWGL
jgi:hypothetical protein